MLRSLDLCCQRLLTILAMKAFENSINMRTVDMKFYLIGLMTDRALLRRFCEVFVIRLRMLATHLKHTSLIN